MKKAYTLFLLISFLGGCSTSSTTTKDRHPSKETRMDIAIRGSLNVSYFEHDLDLYQRLNITIDKGRVLLTGNMKDEKMKADALHIAKNTTGVKEIIDRLTIASPRTLSQYLHDKWIKTELGTKLLFTDELESGKYEVEVMEGIVYILGTAINEAERQQVIDTARGISGVKKVIAYISVLSSGVSGAIAPPQHIQPETGISMPPVINQD